MDDVFCSIPWNHVSMTTTGDYRPCCHMDEKSGPQLLRTPQGQILNARRHHIGETRNAPLMQELRATMLEGRRHPHCATCWTREDSGLESRRQQMRLSFPETQIRAAKHGRAEIDPSHFPLEYLDLRFGNRCNLNCRSCGPSSSHQWRLKLKFEGPDPALWPDTSAVVSQIVEMGQGLRRIYFAGGEPLIHPQHWNLLERLVDSGQARGIHLQYNSNIASLPHDKMRLWNAFHSVHITCSVDGLGAYAEYIRPPSRWEKLRENLRALDELPENITASLGPTLSVWNIAHLPEICLWTLAQRLKKFAAPPWLNLVIDPAWCSMQILPKDSKRAVVEKFEAAWELVAREMNRETSDRLRAHTSGLLLHLYAADSSSLRDEFWRQNSAMDSLFARDFATAIPQAHRLVTGTSQRLAIELDY